MSGTTSVGPEVPLLALLQRGARRLSDDLVDRLAAAGVEPITPAHAAVLAHLDDSSSLSIADLARLAGVTRQTMHRSVSRLVDEGLLVSSPGTGFPKSSRIELTELGRRRRDVASTILRGLEEELAEQLGDRALAGLRDGLIRAWPD